MLFFHYYFKLEIDKNLAKTNILLKVPNKNGGNYKKGDQQKGSRHKGSKYKGSRQKGSNSGKGSPTFFCINVPPFPNLINADKKSFFYTLPH